MLWSDCWLCGNKWLNGSREDIGSPDIFGDFWGQILILLGDFWPKKLPKRTNFWPQKSPKMSGEPISLFLFFTFFPTN